MSIAPPPSTFSVGDAPVLSKADPGDGPAPDHLSDATGFIQTVAKNQRIFFEELLVDEECLHEIDGDSVLIEMPRVRIRLPLSKCQFPDQVAKWAADSWYTFAKACFEDLRH